MHHTVLYNRLRNRVNRIRKSLQTQFFLDKVDCLKQDNPSKWWKNMKSICKFNCNWNDSFDNITFANASVSLRDLPEVLNNFFILATAHIPPVDNDRLTVSMTS